MYAVIGASLLSVILPQTTTKWRILILVNLLLIPTSESASERVQFLQTLRYSSHLGHHYFRTFFGNSLEQCHNECLSRKRCKSYNYHRLMNMCQLNDSDDTDAAGDIVISPGVVYNQKADWTKQELDPTCAECSNKQVCKMANTVTNTRCETSECESSTLPNISNSSIIGDLNKIGAKRSFTCARNYVSVGDPTIVCEASGNWSIPDFQCAHKNCWNPTSIDNATSTITINGSSVILSYSCSTGYQMRGSQITCKSGAGYYPSARVRGICCDDPDTPPWTRVYRITSDGEAFIVAYWDSDHYGNSWKDCQFRTASILDNWEHTEIEVVKVEFFELNQVEAFILFNGTGTTIQSWFSWEKLINSSWDDLSANASHLINLQGFQMTISGKTHDVRFAVIDHVDYDNCTEMIGWVAIGVPCATSPELNRNPNIMYSKTNVMSNFDWNTIGHADKMEISVKVKS